MSEVQDGAEGKGEVVKEKEKQERLLQNYTWTIARAADDNWGTLDPAPAPQPSLWSWFGGGDEKLPEAVPVGGGNATFWLNYDIVKSLSPTLYPSDQYDAAKSIARALRAYLARKVRERKRSEVERNILRREIVKIQTLWRRHDASRRYTEVRERVGREQREQRAYDNFRNLLLGKGYKLLRWSHSKRSIVPCVVRVDRTREYFVFEQHTAKRKRYAIQDIKGVTKGNQSQFLKEYMPKEPDKQLSLYFQNRKKKGDEAVSVDIVFDAADKTKQEKEVSASDGKVRRNRFYNNFAKLQKELESDDAFFFNHEGVYCRVGKSVFERWERITMVDPKWDGTDQEQRRIRLQRDKRAQLQAAQQLQRKRRAGCWYPLPLEPRDRPQAGDANGVINIFYGTEEVEPKGLEYGATWFSRTIEIDYGNNEAHLSRSWYFRNPMRKEEFILQRCVKQPGKDFVPRFVEPTSSRKRRAGAAANGAARAQREPVRARLMELKPFFEDKLKEIYGDIGIAGWRNSETGEFEFEDADWRRLCKLARNINKLARKAADTLEEAMNEDVEARKLQLLVRGATEADGDGPTSPTQTPRPAPPVRDLTPLRKNLLRNMWKERDQRKDHMWRPADITYNTAQKNKMISERRRAERMALEERRAFEEQQRPNMPFGGSDGIWTSTNAEPPRFPSISTSAVTHPGQLKHRTGHINPDDIAGPAGDGAEASRPSDGAGEMEAVPSLASGISARTVTTDVAHKDGRKIELAVLETSSKKHQHVPLGLRVGKLDLSECPLVLRGKKRDVRITCSCALVVNSITPNAVPSISHAWQNQILARRDLVVAINGKTPDSIDELVNLTQHCRKPRGVTLFRITGPDRHDKRDSRHDDKYATMIADTLRGSALIEV